MSFDTCKENIGKINMLSHKEIYKHEKSEHKYHTLGYDAMQKLQQEKDKPNNIKHFGALITHGERGDHIEKVTYLNKVDPPLTPLGMK